MCLGTTFPAWQALAIKELASVAGVQITLLIVDQNALGSTRSSIKSEARSLRSRLTSAVSDRTLFRRLCGRLARFIQNCIFLRGFSLFRWYCRRRIARMPCEQPVDLSHLLGSVRMLGCRTEFRGRFSQHFSPADVNAIKTYDLDLILRFGFGIIRGEILGASRYGVWSYHHDDHLRYRGGPPGFWEIYYGETWNGAMLQRLTERLDDGIVIHKDYFPTLLSSYARNLNQLYMGSAKWPALACKALLDNLQGVFQKMEPSDAPIYKTPNDRQMLWYLAKSVWHDLQRHYRDLFGERPGFTESWALGIIRQPVHQLLTWNVPVDVQWLEPPDGRFFADAFVLKRAEIFYIFFEDFSYELQRGRIGLIETEDWLKFSDPRIVLEAPYHLSYPYMLEHEGHFYCVPEQYESREVVLYEAERFPDHWVSRTALIRDFAGIDPTLLRHDGRWWLFLTNQDNGPQDNLYLFYADGILGPWHAHPKNPVDRSPGKMRPAGRPFVMDGCLFRPTQNCSTTYGGSIIINRITVLSPSEFQERPLLTELGPKVSWPYPEGLHNLCSFGNVTLIDAKRRLAVKSDPREVLFSKARSMRRQISR